MRIINTVRLPPETIEKMNKVRDPNRDIILEAAKVVDSFLSTGSYKYRPAQPGTYKKPYSFQFELNDASFKVASGLKSIERSTKMSMNAILQSIIIAKFTPELISDE